MIRAAPAALLVLATALAGCTPLTVDQAEAACVRDAELAVRPRSEVTLGIGTDGDRVRPFGALSVEISGDTIMRRDPSAVFQRCVVQRSGQVPTRTLSEMPEWRG